MSASVPRVESIEHGGRVLARLVRQDAQPVEKTEFVTQEQDNIQVGWIVYEAGGQVEPHRHVGRRRELVGTPEVIVVQRGRCSLDLYDDAGALVHTAMLGQGDLAILLAGGHGFRMHERTVLLEVKQGPFLGPAEKERFPPADHRAPGEP